MKLRCIKQTTVFHGVYIYGKQSSTMNKVMSTKGFIKEILFTYGYSCISVFLCYILYTVFCGNCKFDSIETGYIIIFGPFLIAPMLTLGLTILQLITKVFNLRIKVLASFILVFVFVCSIFLIYEYSENLISPFLYNDNTQFYKYKDGGIEVISNKRYEYDWLFWLFSYFVSAIFTVFVSLIKKKWEDNKIHR